MKVFIVHAHPERRSLNSALTDIAVDTMTDAGHEVRVSDLYAMRWKSTIEAADFGAATSSPLDVVHGAGWTACSPTVSAMAWANTTPLDTTTASAKGPSRASAPYCR